MCEQAEEWQVARRRKGTPRRSKAPQGSLTPQDQGCGQDGFNTKKTLLRIRETMSELRCEDFWLDWKKLLLLLLPSSAAASAPSPDGGAPELPVDRPEEGSVGTAAPGLECVCYGLGPFSSCVSARYQLAMMLLLLEALEIPPRLCWVFDPVFSAGEKEVLRELDLSVLTENEEGKRLTKRPTVFYLMHCGKALYNNLLWRNWERETLPLLTIIGNSFSGIQERTIERELRRDYGYLTQAVALCEERPLPCPPRLLDVFNDTALITFPPGRLRELPQCTWAEPAEPRYEHCPDLEIILREEDGEPRRRGGGEEERRS